MKQIFMKNVHSNTAQKLRDYVKNKNLSSEEKKCQIST